MTDSIEALIEKYKLEDFSEPLHLTPEKKIEFLNSLREIDKTFSIILDKMTSFEKRWAGQTLIALIKLITEKDKEEQKDEIPPYRFVKAKIGLCLGQERTPLRYESLNPALEVLEDRKFVKIEEKKVKLHFVTVYNEMIPNFNFLYDIINNHWECPNKNWTKINKFDKQK